MVLTFKELSTSRCVVELDNEVKVRRGARTRLNSTLSFMM